MPLGELKMAAHAPVVAGCYGKMPGAGDFLSRRLPREVVLTFDEWMQTGLLHLRAIDAGGWEGHYAAAPAWNLLMPAPVVRGQVIFGALAASRDRVGRPFPLCLLMASPPEHVGGALLQQAPATCARLSEIAVTAVRNRLPPDRVDELLAQAAVPDPADGAGSGAGADILEVLGSAATELDATTVPLSADVTPWPDLARSFDPRGNTSHWWTSAGNGAAIRGFTHSGRLDAALFATLFAGSAHRPRGSSAAA